MSTMFFGVSMLAEVYLVSRCDPKSLIKISEANAAAFREHYAVGDVHAPTLDELIAAATNLPCTADVVKGAITTAAVLDGNCEHETDFRTEEVLRAFADVLPKMMLTASSLHAHDMAWVLHTVREHSRELYFAREDRKSRPPLPTLSDEVIKLTGDTRTEELLRKEGLSGLRVGDHVSDEIYYYMLEVVPPACSGHGLLQVGEPSDHNGPGNRPRFATLQRYGTEWIYTGRQALRVRVKIEG